MKVAFVGAGSWGTGWVTATARRRRSRPGDGGDGALLGALRRAAARLPRPGRLGELIATCASPQSRDHSVGIELGRGRKVDEIIASMRMVAEGVNSCKPIYELGSEADVRMAITEKVVRGCHGGRSVDEVVPDPLSREIRSPFHGVEELLTLAGS